MLLCLHAWYVCQLTLTYFAACSPSQLLVVGGHGNGSQVSAHKNTQDVARKDRNFPVFSYAKFAISLFSLLSTKMAMTCALRRNRFMMTTLLVFIKAGSPGQLTVGTFVTLIFLIAALIKNPFCTDALNSLNCMGLFAQLCTLLVGIMIAMLDAIPEVDGATDRTIISIMVVLVNGLTLIWPLARKVLTGASALI